MENQRQLKSSVHKLAYMKKYHKNNRDARNAYNRVYYRNRRKQDPLYSRRQDLKHDFGMSLEDYDTLWESQGRRCKLCGRQREEGERAFDVDHDHSTGKVRGILCCQCNNGLGYFKDNASILKKAAEYLEMYSN
jgi:hypothetical protein